MQAITEFIALILSYVIKLCFTVVKNYGAVIILFTLLSKIVLLPLSIWVHKNGIKLIKMQPDINFIKVKHYGDADSIAEKTSELYKKEQYSPLASTVPLLIQLVILFGLVEVIYNPLTYIVNMPQDLSNAFISLTSALTGVNAEASSVQMAVVNAVQNPQYAVAFNDLAQSFSQYDVAGYISEISKIGMKFAGMELSWIAVETKGISFIMPLLAGFSAWLMCFTQNISQVLQSEQGKLNKYGTMILSVALSLYLGAFVPAGIGLYWIASNLIAIVQMYILNFAINPKKYIDYEKLKESKQALDELSSLGEAKKGLFVKDENAKREKADYKKFFSVVNKHIVFYSEKSGFWKYFENFIEALLSKSNVVIHYVTNDPNDAIFERAKTEPRIKPYYIGQKKLITLMMKMDADIVVMTTPDLETYYIKRSYIRNDIEYIYVPHDPMSVHMGFREGSMDHFDTVFCVGPQQIAEIRKTEEVYNLRAKNLIECGYVLIDNLLKGYEKTEKDETARKRILIAPTWNEDNILDSCIDEMLEKLLCDKYKVVVRPHPEYVKRYGAKFEAFKNRWLDKTGDGFEIEDDFSSNSSIFTADLLITDWSGIAYEYSYTTKHPTLFINTKMKVLNENWEKIGITPLEVSLRNKIGNALEKEQIPQIADSVKEMIANSSEYESRINKVLQDNVFNIGHSGEVGADYILKRLVDIKKNKQK